MKFKLSKILTFSFICVFTLVILYVNLDQKIENQNIKEQMAKTQSYYVVKDYNGKIAVFENGEHVPKTIFESYTSLLPEHDRILLINGIRAETEEELQKIIEDFTS